MLGHDPQSNQLNRRPYLKRYWKITRVYTHTNAHVGGAGAYTYIQQSSGRHDGDHKIDTRVQSPK